MIEEVEKCSEMLYLLFDSRVARARSLIPYRSQTKMPVLLSKGLAERTLVCYILYYYSFSRQYDILILNRYETLFAPSIVDYSQSHSVTKSLLPACESSLLSVK